MTVGAITYKVLGQSTPAATADTTVYTVPASTVAIISTITVCNTGAATSFRIRVSAAGASAVNAQYIYYDVTIPANDTFVATLGLTLEAASLIRVYNTLATVAFNVYGVEIATA